MLTSKYGSFLKENSADRFFSASVFSSGFGIDVGGVDPSANSNVIQAVSHHWKNTLNYIEMKQADEQSTTATFISKEFSGLNESTAGKWGRIKITEALKAFY
jgi:hypothetical protein